MTLYGITLYLSRFPARPKRPSSERLWFIEKSIELYMVTKVDNHGL